MVDEDNYVSEILVFVSKEKPEDVFIKENNDMEKTHFKTVGTEIVKFKEDVGVEGYLLTLDDSEAKSEDSLPKLIYYIKDENIISKIGQNEIFDGEKGHILSHDGSVYGGIIRSDIPDLLDNEFLLEINREFSILVHPIFGKETIDVDKFLNKIKEIASEVAESRKQRTEEIYTERELITQQQQFTKRDQNKSLELHNKFSDIKFSVNNTEKNNLRISIQNEIIQSSESETDQSHPNTSRDIQSKDFDETSNITDNNFKSLNESKFKKKKEREDQN